MNTIKKRSNIILILTIAFFAGLLYHTVNIFINAEDWVINLRNLHLTAAGNLDYAGTIYDRNGEVLAYSSGGERFYNDDESIRKACLHVVGDDSTVNLYNSIQNIYRSELIGMTVLSISITPYKIYTVPSLSAIIFFFPLECRKI